MRYCEKPILSIMLPVVSYEVYTLSCNLKKNVRLYLFDGFVFVMDINDYELEIPFTQLLY